MKLPMMIIAVLFCATAAMAQTEKGTIFVNANSNFGLSFNQSETTSDTFNDSERKSNSFFISPGAGYFIIDNLVAGANVSFSTTKSEREDPDSEFRGTNYSVGPFVRYYFGSSKYRPFLQASAGIGSAKTTSSSSEFEDTENTANRFSYAVDGGLAIFLNDHISLDLAATYSRSKNKRDDDDSYENINSGVRVGGGFSLYF